MKDDYNPEDGTCDLCDSRCGNAYLNYVGELCDSCVERALPSQEVTSREDLIQLLRDIEWEGLRWDNAACPCCGGWDTEGHSHPHPDFGHKPDCRLAAAIAEDPAPPATLADVAKKLKRPRRTT